MNKTISIFCAMVMILGILAGCGTGSSSVTDGSVSASEPGMASSVAEPSAADDSSVKTMSAVEELLERGDVVGEITVSCYDTSSTKPMLEEAAQRFEANYPGTKINIVSFSKMPEIQTMETDDGLVMVSSLGYDEYQEKLNYMSRVNTEIMSGKGADIYAIDVLPFYKYAKNGYLENLKDYMDADRNFLKSDYRSNLFDALTIDGIQSVMPIEYSFNYLAYDNTLFTDEEQAFLDSMGNASFGKLIEFGAEAFARLNLNSQKPVFMFNGVSDINMFNELFRENYSSYLNIPAKKVNFNDGKFASLLESVKAYRDTGYLPDLSSMDDFERCMFKVKDHYSLSRDFTRDPARRKMFPVMSAFTDDDDKIIGPLKNSEGEMSFRFSNGVGMNANSRNKRLAWEFIKFLLSYEIQASPSIRQLPVNVKAFSDYAKISMSGKLYGFDTDLDEEGERDLLEFIEAVDRLSASINAYFVEDVTVKEFVDSEVFRFLDENKPASEVASAIQNRVSLYVNEG